MTPAHGLYDCIGLPLDGGPAVAGFLQERWPLPGVETPDAGSFTARWSDPSGAKLTVSLDAAGGMDVVPGFEGRTAIRVGRVTAQPEAQDTVVADVVDADGETVTRFTALLDEMRFVASAPDEPVACVLTGLVRELRSYPDQAAFEDSADSWLGGEPNDADGLRLGPQSFIPVGMFHGEPWDPMALVTAVVVEAERKVNAASGAAFHAARVTTLDDVAVHLCWPEGFAPLPSPGDVVYAEAYLTASIPSLMPRKTIRVRC